MDTEIHVCVEIQYLQIFQNLAIEFSQRTGYHVSSEGDQLVRIAVEK